MCHTNAVKYGYIDVQKLNKKSKVCCKKALLCFIFDLHLKV